MHVDHLLAPALRASLAGALQPENVPSPTDEPTGHASGPDALRVLVIGAGPTKGWGVRSHQLALPGQLARELGRRTGRGVDIRSKWTEGLPDATAIAAAMGRGTWDAAILTLGVADAVQHVAPGALERRIQESLAVLRTGSAGLPVAITGVVPVTVVHTISPPLLPLAARFIARANEVIGELAGTIDATLFVPLQSVEEPTARIGVRTYASWAAAISEALAPALTKRAHAQEATPRPDTAPALDAEVAQRLHAQPSAELDRLVSVARTTFGARYAAVSLLDDERTWFRGGDDFPIEVVPRAVSLCSYTVERRGGFLVPDLAADDRFIDNPALLDHGIHFYAGYPLESEDGTAIGALCLLDDKAHGDDVDLALLRDLALLVQRELRALEQTPVAAPETARAAG